MADDDADYEIDNPGVPSPATAGEAAAIPGIPGTGPQAPDDDEFDLPPLPELPRTSGRPETPDGGGQERADADEQRHPDEVPESAPDLEAIYAAATGMGAMQADVLEAVTANHWAWYVTWQERGFSEKRAFALLRVMVREQCRA